MFSGWYSFGGYLWFRRTWVFIMFNSVDVVSSLFEIKLAVWCLGIVLIVDIVIG